MVGPYRGTNTAHALFDTINDGKHAAVSIRRPGQVSQGPKTAPRRSCAHACVPVAAPRKRSGKKVFTTPPNKWNFQLIIRYGNEAPAVCPHPEITSRTLFEETSVLHFSRRPLFNEEFHGTRDAWRGHRLKLPREILLRFCYSARTMINVTLFFDGNTHRVDRRVSTTIAKYSFSLLYGVAFSSSFQVDSNV